MKFIVLLFFLTLAVTLAERLPLIDILRPTDEADWNMPALQRVRRIYHAPGQRAPGNGPDLPKLQLIQRDPANLRDTKFNTTTPRPIAEIQPNGSDHHHQEEFNDQIYHQPDQEAPRSPLDLPRLQSIQGDPSNLRDRKFNINIRLIPTDKIEPSESDRQKDINNQIHQILVQRRQISPLDLPREQSQVYGNSSNFGDRTFNISIRLIPSGEIQPSMWDQYHPKEFNNQMYHQPDQEVPRSRLDLPRFQPIYRDPSNLRDRKFNTNTRRIPIYKSQPSEWDFHRQNEFGTIYNF